MQDSSNSHSVPLIQQLSTEKVCMHSAFEDIYAPMQCIPTLANWLCAGSMLCQLADKDIALKKEK